LLWFHIIIDFFFFLILLIIFIIRDKRRKKEFESFVRDKVGNLINEFDTIANWQIARLESKINEIKKIEYEIAHIYDTYIPEKIRNKILEYHRNDKIQNQNNVAKKK